MICLLVKHRSTAEILSHCLFFALHCYFVVLLHSVRRLLFNVIYFLGGFWPWWCVSSREEMARVELVSLPPDSSLLPFFTASPTVEPVAEMQQPNNHYL